MSVACERFQGFCRAFQTFVWKVLAVLADFAQWQLLPAPCSAPLHQGVCAVPAAPLSGSCMQFLLREMSPATALPTLALAARLACASLHRDAVRQAVRECSGTRTCDRACGTVHRPSSVEADSTCALCSAQLQQGACLLGIRSCISAAKAHTHEFCQQVLLTRCGHAVER